jgi:hypothetical protein
MILFWNHASTAGQNVTFKYNGTGPQIFFPPNSQDCVIGPIGSCLLVYDSVEGGWAVLAINGGLQTLGTATNNNAAAGNVGEYVNSTVGPIAAGLTGAYKGITSISLTAGDWDVSSIAVITNNGATISGPNTQTISVVTDGSDNVIADNTIYMTGTSSYTWGGSIGRVRMSLASTTTVNVVVSVTYTVATPNVYASIRARRVR